MTLKDKLLFALLTIITLGLYLLIVFVKKPTQPNKTLLTDEKITIDVDKMLQNIGGKENVVAAEFTYTKIKIFIENKDKVNVDALSDQKGISGVFATSKYITLIVGKSAKQIANQLI